MGTAGHGTAGATGRPGPRDARSHRRPGHGTTAAGTAAAAPRKAAPHPQARSSPSNASSSFFLIAPRIIIPPVRE